MLKTVEGSVHRVFDYFSRQRARRQAQEAEDASAEHELNAIAARVIEVDEEAATHKRRAQLLLEFAGNRRDLLHPHYPGRPKIIQQDELDFYYEVLREFNNPEHPVFLVDLEGETTAADFARALSRNDKRGILFFRGVQDEHFYDNYTFYHNGVVFARENNWGLYASKSSSKHFVEQSIQYIETDKPPQLPAHKCEK